MLQNDLCSVRAAELVHRAGTSWPPPEQGLWSPAGWHYPGGEPQGLYNPREQDSCGVSCVMDIDPEREASHETLELLLEAHECQEHRGACASDRRTGDGCGVNVWLPWSYFQTELADRGADVPEGTPIGVGMLFFPEEPHRVRALQQCAEAALREHFGEDVVYRWRVVSIESSKIGDHADRTRPAIYQLMVVRPDSCDGDEWHFEFKLFALKKYLEQQEVWIRNKAYICSFSCRQIVYKLLGTGGQLRAFYNDLRDPAFKIRGGIAHERFSTNTTSRWALAQPFSQMCHNGEITTLLAVLANIQAWERALGDDWAWARPFVRPDTSDSGMINDILELMRRTSDKPLEHILAMMMPAASETYLDFWRYQRSVMPATDGPAAIVAFDGTRACWRLDRNGLRPSRWAVTKDGYAIMASEAGVVNRYRASDILRTGQLGPGESIVADAETGEVLVGDEVIASLNSVKDHAADCRDLIVVPDTPSRDGLRVVESDQDNRFPNLVSQATAYGWRHWDVHAVIRGMLTRSGPIVRAMGNDVTLAVLSELGQPVDHYLKHRFNQVTAPPVAGDLETNVVDLTTLLGPKLSPFGINRATGARGKLPMSLELGSPVMFDNVLAWVEGQSHLQVAVLDATFPVGESLEAALEELCVSASREIARGAKHLIVTDRNVGPARRPIPILLAQGYLNEHLIQTGERVRATVTLDSGEVRHEHLFAALLGYGGASVNPFMMTRVTRWYLETLQPVGTNEFASELGLSKASIEEAIAQLPTVAFGQLEGLARSLGLEHADGDAGFNPLSYAVIQLENLKLKALLEGARYERVLKKALEKSLVKIMNKVGITTVLSYIGARLFEIYGLEPELSARAFGPTPHLLGGDGLRRIDEIYGRFHREATRAARSELFIDDGSYADAPGEGERRGYTPRLVLATHRMTGLTRNGVAVDNTQPVGPTDAAIEGYKEAVGASGIIGLQNLLDHVPLGDAIDPTEVMSFEDFGALQAAGSISDGSIGEKPHIVHALGLNLVGGRSSSGEGGLAEDRSTFAPPDHWPKKWTGRKRFDRWPDPGCKEVQIASARFGTHLLYITKADWVQIKVAQGAKPGEGGHLPGLKVTIRIGKQRIVLPGVELISPAPHHDIYSIEELYQLIYDIMAVNPRCKVSVKLVACAGVGQIAVGCVKAGASNIHVSGGEGGTGASPYASIMYAGGPWVLGLGEVNEALMRERLRKQCTVAVDGGLKTAHDILLAWKLGADYISWGTLLMIAAGCVKTNKCNQDSCPVGYATQKKRLIEQYPGTPKNLVFFFYALYEDLKQLMAEQGIRHYIDVRGRSDLLKPRTDSDRAVELTTKLAADIERILHLPPDYWEQRPRTPDKTDNRLRSVQFTTSQAALTAAWDLIESGVGHQVVGPYRITNTRRAVAARLSFEITERHGVRGIDGELRVKTRGVAGQSYGVWLAPGVTLEHTGLANDFVGKHLSGGRIVIQAPEDAAFDPHVSVLAGNACAYGATSGELFIGGTVGQRFCVRNSGVTAVVEGAGAHLAEYMTGGHVVCLSLPGTNVGAGMSAGLLQVYDESGELHERINSEWVSVKPVSPENAEALRQLLMRYVKETNSQFAQDILDDWENRVQHFYDVETIRPRATVDPDSGPDERPLHERLEEWGFVEDVEDMLEKFAKELEAAAQ